jgi:uncharacterized YigZ family protein
VNNLSRKDFYHTIAGPSEGQYKEKGSKFLAFVFPISSMDEITSNVHALKKQYHDARHHCYAWILGSEGHRFRAFDDGEPNHSAGDPILGQIRSRSLTNTLVVVVRYFGGTKLGVGGLVNAYRTAAAHALDQNRIVKRFIKETFKIQYDYTLTNPVMRIIEELGASIDDQQYEEKCRLVLSIRQRDAAVFIQKLKSMKGIRIVT